MSSSSYLAMVPNTGQTVILNCKRRPGCRTIQVPSSGGKSILGLKKVAHSTSLKSQIFAPKSNNLRQKAPPRALNSTKAIMLNTGINSIFLS